MDADEEAVRSLKRFFSERDSRSLESQAASLAREALVRTDSVLVDLSILAFVLSKLSNKQHIIESRSWGPASGRILSHLEEAALQFKGGARVKAGESVRAALNDVDALGLAEGRFVSSMVEKGRIKAAAQMYAHGASLGAVASFTGASKSDLADYVGNTNIPDKYSSMPVRERLEAARKVFS
ncbi:MAG: hypothetical protein WC607_02125 [Candidatus Micrarchaeia archaeon]